VENSQDADGDPLVYEYEVYTDSVLTEAGVLLGGVAEGSATTAWTVTTDLAENATYWWRARGP